MPVNFSGSYTENFDSLSNTAGSTTNFTLPAGWEITESGGGARDNEQYGVDTGASNTGDTYSYGASVSTERALGGLQTGTLIPLFGSSFTNTTGSVITSLTVSYTGEQWRLGTAGRIDRLDFQYSLDATSLTTGTWVDADTLDFTAPITTGSIGALDGNLSANRTAVTATITGLNIPVGATFWFRWQDLNASSADDGLAIDDFSLSTPTPVGPTVNLSVNTTAGTETGTTVITVTATASSAVTGNQTVNLGVSGTGITTGDYSLSNSTITIPDGQTTGTVTFTVVNDALVEGTETATLTISNPSSSITLGSTTSQAITITDSETATVTFGGPIPGLDENIGNYSQNAILTITSDSGEGSLASDLVVPFREVVFGNGPNDAQVPTDFYLLTSTVTFAAGSTNGATQAVEIAIVDDAIDEADDEFFDIGFNLANYSGIATLVGEQTFLISDNDTAGVTITQSGGSTAITEGGATDSYTVVLNSQPTANVTITLNSGAQATTNPTTLTFTAANWNVAQTVTITAIDDATFEGFHSAAIAHTASSTDTKYNGIAISNVTATITDNEIPLTVYVSPTFTGSNGSIIADADLGTTGNQTAQQGADAFATIAAAQAAVATNGTIIVNSGTYAETITLSGTQTLEITGTDTTQAVTIDDLTTVAGNSVILEGASTLTFGDADNRTLAGTISGSGNLIKQGSGTITVSGNNTYTGATTINAGTLQATANNALGTTEGVTTVAGGATLDLRNVTYSTTESVILQGGAIANSSGTTTFAGSVTMTANSNFNTNSSVLVLTGAVTGNFRLTKQNAGTLRLSNTGNSFSSFQINGGDIQLGASEVIPDTADMISNSGNGFDLNGFDETLDSLFGNGGFVNSQPNLVTLTIGAGNNNASSSFNGAVNGAINVIKVGTGRQVWGAGGSTYTGTTTINGGILAVSTEVGGGAVQALGATSGETIVNTGGTLEFRSVIYALAEPVTLNGGTIRSQTGSSSFGGAITLTGTGFINGSGNLTLNGAIAESGGAQSLTFNNTGTVTLTGVNTYTGATTINSGTVFVNGSLAAGSAVTVNNSGILSGDGSVNGAVAIASGGTLRPGTTIGDLDTGSVTFVSGSNFTVDLNGTAPVTQYDRLNVTGGVNLGGATLNLSGSYSPAADTSFTLISNDGSDAVNGTFNGLAQGSTVLFNGVPLLVSYIGGDGNDVTLSTMPIVNLSVSSTAGTEAGTTSITVTATASSAVVGNQTVSLGVSGTGITSSDYNLSNTTITIPNGQTSGSVTFTVVDDAIAEDSETATLTISNPSSGLFLGSTTTQAITIADNDNAGVVITQSGGSTTVTEGGATDSYTIVLTSQPTADVTITLNPGGQLSTPTTLTFTAQNWNVAQTVAVSAINDDIAEGNHSGTIAHTASSSDLNYNGITIDSVTTSITDNDNAGVTITQSGGSTTVTEGETTDSYTVVLTSQPTADVTITLNPGGQLSTPTTLTFTAQNWNVAQTVAVSAINDDIAEGNHSGTITHTASSSDLNYNGITIDSVTTSITDNDNAGVVIAQSSGSTAVTEGGAIDSYTVVLTSQPTADVTVNLAVDGQTTLSTNTLTFTAQNWNVAQTITVTAVNDNIAEGIHTSTISHAASSSDGNYNSIAVNNVTATITDNDTAGVTITQSGGSTTVNEGSTTDSYTIVLNTQPTANVTLTLNGGSQLTPNPTQLTFTPQNWNVAQIVTVTAIDDLLNEGTHTSAIVHTASSSDANYNNLAISNVAVSIIDNDNPPTDITLSPTSVNENVGQNTVIGTFATIDPDGGSFSYALVSGSTANNNSAFQISGNQLQLINSPDFETRSSYQIRVSTTDSSNLSFEKEFTIAVNDLNDAPILLDTSVALGTTRMNAGAPVGAVGTLVSQLVGFSNGVGQKNITDPDAGAKLGIALSAVNTSNGSWFYSTDNGTNWTVITTVSDSNALLLAADANTRLYFQPNTSYSGVITNAITFRAWDQTSGSNGTLANTSPNGNPTAFSTTTDTASVEVKKTQDIDFNSDGNTDLLWRNVVSGDLGFWALNGTTLLQSSALGNVPMSSGWEPVGAGDFTNDGKTDILWRNRITGDNGFWEMDGSTLVKAHSINPSISVDSGWDIVGVSDFTNDSYADILWRNYKTGENGVWQMQGATLVKAQALISVDPAANWDVVGVSDFTSDGNPDILWRNRVSGENGFWEMQGTTMVKVHTIETIPVNTGWQIAGAGDFTKDGKADILWRNTLDGQAGIWAMNGTTRTDIFSLTPTIHPATGWTIV